MVSEGEGPASVQKASGAAGNTEAAGLLASPCMTGAVLDLNSRLWLFGRKGTFTLKLGMKTTWG